MKRIIPGLIVVVLVMVGSWALAQTAGEGMMVGEGHRYGAMGGYLWWWGAYGLIKAAVVVIGLWLLYRVTVAVEKIAASKS
jgi:hypothetical protein